jgi:hypothetical protein
MTSFADCRIWNFIVRIKARAMAVKLTIGIDFDFVATIDDALKGFMASILASANCTSA